MTAGLIVSQRMLNIGCYGTVDIFVCALFARERHLHLVIVLTTQAHGSAESDIQVNPADPEHILEFMVRDERRVNHPAPVIELIRP